MQLSNIHLFFSSYDYEHESHFIHFDAFYIDGLTRSFRSKAWTVSSNSCY
ncbi:hypothetical protein THOB06_30001 [Vibrio rotiferianus]|nr:hypothetical protein THOE12_170098 [Vibrio rotiferianus]CAH1579280.1 hypothetical protein THOG10_30001 [Vibrio rotiferianus]CAH1581347.1 hypothetical protein THOB06_30001 [Vibrio rotiferianus]